MGPDSPKDGHHTLSAGTDSAAVQELQHSAEHRKMEQTKAQVNEVVGIMRQNVEKVLEREVKLQELVERADRLETGASAFYTGTGRLQRKFWWENMKMTIILCVITVVIIIVLGVALYYGS